VADLGIDNGGERAVSQKSIEINFFAQRICGPFAGGRATLSRSAADSKDTKMWRKEL